jgi:hypothetical protein
MMAFWGVVKVAGVAELEDHITGSVSFGATSCPGPYLKIPFLCFQVTVTRAALFHHDRQTPPTP